MSQWNVHVSSCRSVCLKKIHIYIYIYMAITVIFDDDDDDDDPCLKGVPSGRAANLYRYCLKISGPFKEEPQVSVAVWNPQEVYPVLVGLI